MLYDDEDDILTAEQIVELAEQGFHPGQPYETDSEIRSMSPYELDVDVFTAEKLAQIDAVADLDTSAPPPAPSFGPLRLIDTFPEVTKARVGLYPHPWQVDNAVALYEGSRDVR